MRDHIGPNAAGRQATRRVLAHTADTGIEATASGFAELIEEFATGMFALMALAEPCAPIREVRFEIESDTYEDLVVDTLAELLFRFETEDLLFCDVGAEMMGPTRVQVRAGGISTEEVELVGPPIKAVTYHDLQVIERDGGWYGRVYFDV
jgi:SHS2 domain-containing protein